MGILEINLKDVVRQHRSENGLDFRAHIKTFDVGVGVPLELKSPIMYQVSVNNSISENVGSFTDSAKEGLDPFELVFRCKGEKLNKVVLK